jgi:DNA-binding HxlR family transcriptional regulator
MSWDDVSEGLCPVARSLASVGDRWTLLILHELSMGVRRFDELQAQTGMSSHLLSLRLKKLEEDGVIERRVYSERPLRHEYHATQKGRELDPILIILRGWGMKWQCNGSDAEPSTTLIYKPTGETIDASWRLPSHGPMFSFDDVEMTISEAFRVEREARRQAFQAGRRGA